MDIGHNNPPQMAGLASEVAKSLSDWMAENPVIDTAEVAKTAKLQIDRAKLCLKDIDDEKSGRTKPLNEQIRAIQKEYHGPISVMEGILTELTYRMQVFIFKEEERRKQIAKELAEKAEQARLAALEAERIEKEKLDDAAQGEVGVKVAEVIAHADRMFEDFANAKRAAIRAESETHVKVSGGFSRALSWRHKETLTVAGTLQAICAIEEMGCTKDIETAILKSARAYRKVHGKLPNGVTSLVEKSL